MDWDDDDDFISASQEAALQALERRSGGGGSGAAPQLAAPQPAHPPSASTAAGVQAAAPPAPVVRRRKLPAILSDGPPAGGSSSTAAAAGAPAGNPPADENLPPACFAGRLCYAHTGYEVDQLCQQLLQSGVAAVGLDIEWRVLYQTGVPPRPVALIQLCFSSSQPAFGGTGYSCLLLHICHSGITPHLRQLLTSPQVLKVGVGIHGDSLKIQRDFGIEMHGVVCLSEYANARLVAPAAPATAPAALASAAAGSAAAAAPAVAAASAAGQLGSGSIPCVACPQKWSLAGLVSLLLRLRLEKSQTVRCSNWEARPPLSGEQQAYAATDAWASLRVYEPAKMAVYQAMVHQGLSVQAIAAQRRIQEDSVQSNMAAAIAAGLGYSWSCLGVPMPVLQQVAEVCSQLLGRPLACQPPQLSGQAMQQQPHPQQQQPQQQQQQAQQQPQEQQCHVGSKRPPPCSPGSLAAAAAESAERGPSAAESAATAADEAVDLLDVLLAAGHKLRELKETHFAEISYGWLRLTLAHLGRCNPGPWS